MSLQKIQNLKLLLGGLESFSPREFLKAPLLEDGLPKGQIIELIGNGRTEWLLQFLSAEKETQVFWCESEQRILPLALQQRGLDLHRLTFGVFKEKLAQPLRKIIQSQAYEYVVAPNDIQALKVYQALQLLTEKTGTTLFLLARKKLSDAWPIAMQIQIQQSKVKVLKQKFRSSL